MLVACIAFVLVAGVILRRSRARRIREQIEAGTFGGLSEEFALLSALPAGIENRRRSSGQSVRVRPDDRRGAVRARRGVVLGGLAQGGRPGSRSKTTEPSETRCMPRLVEAQPHRPRV